MKPTCIQRSAAALPFSCWRVYDVDPEVPSVPVIVPRETPFTKNSTWFEARTTASRLNVVLSVSVVLRFTRTSPAPSFFIPYRVRFSDLKPNPTPGVPATMYRTDEVFAVPKIQVRTFTLRNDPTRLVSGS